MNKELIGKELEKLKNSDGELLPQNVVDYAKSHPKSELHKHFNWDVNEAANSYWLQRARYLISACVIVHVEEGGEEVEIRAYYREGETENDEERAAGYVSTEDMLDDPAQRRKIILTTIKRVLGILDSYPLRELEPLVKLAQQLLRKYEAAKQLVTK